MDRTALCGDAAQPSIQTPVDDRRWYALCGTRLYSVGTIAGGFPDRGQHQPLEMGGIWAPPLKLLDGYWLALQARADGQEPCWLTAPDSWHLGPDGAAFSYALPALGVVVERREWIVPDKPVMVIDLTISQHPTATWQDALALTCTLAVRSDLHGAWLAEERLGWTDGDDLATYDEAAGAVLLRDALHPHWEVCVGAAQMPTAWKTGSDVWGPERTSGRGVGAALSYPCSVTSALPAQMRFLIAGAGTRAAGENAEAGARERPTGARLAEPGEAKRSRPEAQPRQAPAAVGAGASTPAAAVFARLARADTADVCALEAARQQASERFRAPFTRCRLESPDAHLDQVFAWAKAWSAMLMLDAPGVGRAAMAGLPEFPWWFGCDLAYGVLPMLPAGQTEDARVSLRALASISQQASNTGAVAHEIVSHGLVAHRGNLVETPLFARALYHTYRWTGDRALLAELFPFCAQGVEQWALGACLEPGERAPRGSSIVETPEMAAGLQALDVAAYLVEALDLLGALASELSQDETAARLRARASDLRRHLREDWWLPAERLFGDLRASRAELAALQQRLEALPTSDASARTSSALLRQTLAADRQPEADPQRRRPWLLFHMVQALAADAGLPDQQQAAELLSRLETPEWTEPYGLVLNALTNRRVMTLPTGALAVGEARYGRAQQALAAMQRMATAFGADMPGTLSEYAPGEGAADNGCFLQLWSNYGIIWPVVHYFFGLRPDVANRHLACVPQLPDAWPAARLRALPLGESEAEIALAALPDGVEVRLEMTTSDWEVALGAVLPAGARVMDATLNGEPVILQSARLAEYEGRETWLAPARRGARRYDLRVSWSRDAQSAHR